MVSIVILVVLAMLFLVAELVLLPGFTISGILALCSASGAIYLAYTNFGSVVGTIVVVVVISLAIVVVALSLRAKTWQRFALSSKLESQASKPIEERVSIGQRGISVSRLSPMGGVEISGEIYEAKLVNGYLDSKREVEVVGYENSNIIVRSVEK